MTDSEKQQLKQFEAKVRQLIRQYNALLKDNEDLNIQNSQLQDTVRNLSSQLTQSQQDYRILKTARMIEVSDGDMNNAKQTITQLVREVNKCIGLLKAEQVIQTVPDGDGSFAGQDFEISAINDANEGNESSIDGGEMAEGNNAEDMTEEKKEEKVEEQPVFDFDGLFTENKTEDRKKKTKKNEDAPLPSLFPEF